MMMMMVVMMMMLMVLQVRLRLRGVRQAKAVPDPGGHAQPRPHGVPPLQRSRALVLVAAERLRAAVQPRAREAREEPLTPQPGRAAHQRPVPANQRRGRGGRRRQEVQHRTQQRTVERRRSGKPHNHHPRTTPARPRARCSMTSAWTLSRSIEEAKTASEAAIEEDQMDRMTPPPLRGPPGMKAQSEVWNGGTGWDDKDGSGT